MAQKDLFGNVIVKKNVLKDKFKILPFSVLDSKSKDWVNRKRKWLSLGIQSEIGRDCDLLGFKEVYSTGKERPMERNSSVFDPVICELMYDWFTKEGNKVLDPFAGGSVRGIVSNYMNREYLGIELREEQVKANIEQGESILEQKAPIWIHGDSDSVLDNLTDKFDFIFSCPPYFNLEVYSNDENDLSNMDYDSFCDKYSRIIKKSCDLLNDNRFACFVVGDVRHKNKTHNWYTRFVHDTIQSFLDSGLHYYNEFIYLEAIGTQAMRLEQAFSKRKNLKVHQKILVFYKGKNVNDIRDYFND